MRMKRLFSLRSSLLILVAAASVFSCVPTARCWDSHNSGGENDNDDENSCIVYSDGIYKKFHLDLGYAGRTHRFTIFTYGAGTSSSPFISLDVSGSSSSATSVVEGDIALAGAYSRLNVSNWGRVNGDRYEQTTSSETHPGNGFIGGSRFSDSSTNSSLNSGITALKNVSTSAAALTATSGSPTNLSLNATSQTFSNNPFGGKYVMKLGNFVLDNHSTLTLNGAEGSAFVINVSGNFSLANGSKIVLTGGLTASDVLFNITGASGTFSITGDSIFSGTLLAYNSASSAQRTLTIAGSKTEVSGEVIVNKVVITSGAKVKKPKKASCDEDDDDDDHSPCGDHHGDGGDHGDGHGSSGHH